ncbi:hypothetical protein PR002_g28085 [Phytophthora rubi]|uniref:Uncharacterized protein n=1 Tax=Phytophthora rubi TaxID=129364 RepID=A0A6A3HF21_9STRA|nr:hypothetical protein PR002_g28085 [Phytophthora rubi]
MRVETAKFNASLYTSAKDAAGADALFKADEGGVLWRCQARALLLCFSKNVHGLSAWVARYYRLLVRIRIVYIRLYHQELPMHPGRGSGSVSVAAVWGGAAVCVTRLLALMKEKAGISSSGAVSGSTNECTSVAAITVATTAVSGEESSAALTKAGTAAMNRMYARYARESSSFESIPSSADIDAAAREIERVCTGARSDEAAAGVEDCGAAPPGLVALPHRV